MFKKKCKCEKSEKNFRMDVGPFYVDECCKAAGYDDLGNPIQGTPAAEVKSTITDKVLDLVNPPTQLSTPTAQPEQRQSKLDKVRAFFSLGNKISKSKLKDLRIDELKALASERAVADYDDLTRTQLIEALVKQS